MQGHTIPLVLDPALQARSAPIRLLVPSLAVLCLQFAANIAQGQDLNADPLFGSISLESGFSPSPYTVQVSPGGEDESQVLGDSCYGYMRFAQPDFVLNYASGASPLGVFAISDLDITMAINDPAGDWHCNDDSFYLSGTNSGIQFNDPLSGDYQIWIGSYDSGAESTITMLAITESDESEWASIPIGLEEAVFAASFDLNGDVIFGDDSSDFANDGECDDPRFQGPGAALGSSSNHLFKDASDCRTQLQAGMVSLSDPEDMNLGGNMDGDLFGGDADVFTGATDPVSAIDIADAGPFGEVMFALWQAFQAIPGDDAAAVPLPFGLGGGNAPAYDRAAMTELTGIDFGDNSGPFTDDGECDDPRFEGPGASGIDFGGGELTDANDCSSLYMGGSLVFIEPENQDNAIVMDSSGIDFGDNSSLFADDGECDDPRFEGPGTAAFTSETSELHDANDCRSQYESGRITLVPTTASSSAALASGGTSSNQPAAPIEEAYTIGVPRGDIEGATQADGSIYASGSVYGGAISPGDRIGTFNRIPDTADYEPPPVRPPPEIEFGDNSSVFANDGECDDPRFEGEGMAFASFDDDLGRDADDCLAAFEAGTIILIGEPRL